MSFIVKTSMNESNLDLTSSWVANLRHTIVQSCGLKASRTSSPWNWGCVSGNINYASFLVQGLPVCPVNRVSVSIASQITDNCTKACPPREGTSVKLSSVEYIVFIHPSMMHIKHRIWRSKFSLTRSHKYYQSNLPPGEEYILTIFIVKFRVLQVTDD